MKGKQVSNILILIILTIGIILLLRCGGGDGGGGGDSLVIGAVSALYPTSGSDWNDYLSNDGVDAFSATDTACAPASDGPGYSGCLHGGQMRAVEVIGIVTCAGMTASDSLGAFAWTCLPGASSVRFVSTGFRDGKGLSDLLSFTAPGWKLNSVTVYRAGLPVGSTSQALWWSNPVTTGSGGSITTAGTVYLVNSASVSGITLGSDRIAIAVNPSIHMTPSSGTAAVYANNRDFLWVEGNMDIQGNTPFGMHLTGARFSVLSNVSISNTSSSSGLYMWSCSKNLVSGISILNTGSRGMEVMTSSDENTFNAIRVATTAMQGIFVSGSNGNTFSDIKSVNTGTTNPTNGSAIQLFGSSYNTLSGVLASNSRLHGVSLGPDFSSNPSSFNTLVDVTAASNDYAGISVSSPNNFLSGITAAGNENNSATGGLYMSNNSNLVQDALLAGNAFGLMMSNLYNSTFNNIAVSNNTVYGISFALNTSYNHFTGVLKAANNAYYDCYDLSPGGTAPGLVHDTCTTTGLDGSTDYGVGNTSDAAYYISFIINASLGGKLQADDTVNTSDTSGSAVYSDTMDWTGFNRVHRAWGLDSPALSYFPSLGSCNTSDTCRIWDWSIMDADTVLKGLHLYAGGDMANTITHEWHSTTAPSNQDDCDAGSFPGSVFKTDHCESTFLRNAIELQGDKVGNENGLCESGETCLHTPNMASYQGHGALLSAGTFTDGAILNGITLMRYLTNGY